MTVLTISQVSIKLTKLTFCPELREATVCAATLDPPFTECFKKPFLKL